ncbi:MAG: hypothetical protein N2508_16690 [Anaerolineae bacterium]|nr:hypothetical protein [Anaerolineae bacterium]
MARTVEQSPAVLGYLVTAWTVVSLCAHLLGEGISMTPATLRRRLHELGLR